MSFKCILQIVDIQRIADYIAKWPVSHPKTARFRVSNGSFGKSKRHEQLLTLCIGIQNFSSK